MTLLIVTYMTSNHLQNVTFSCTSVYSVFTNDVLQSHFVVCQTGMHSCFLVWKCKRLHSFWFL